MSLETIILAVGTGDADRIDELVETVVDVAGPTGATVVLTHVFTDEEFDEVLESLDYDAGITVNVDEVARRHTTIRRIRDSFTLADIKHEIRGTRGTPGDRIIDLAKETGADLVVVGGRRRTPAGKAVFGSTAQNVLLDSPAPVAFVRGD